MRYTTVTLSLRPTHKQKKRLEETQRIVTDLRNRFVTLCNTDLVEHGYFPSVYDLNAMIPELKKNEPQLKRVHSNTLQNASLKAHEAVAGAYEAGPNKDGSVRIAKLKTREDSMSFEYPSPKHFSIERNLLYLGVMRKDVGGIPFRSGQRIHGPIKKCIISRKKKTWLARLIVEIEDEGIEWIDDDTRCEIGIDLGTEATDHDFRRNVLREHTVRQDDRERDRPHLSSHVCSRQELA